MNHDHEPPTAAELKRDAWYDASPSMNQRRLEDALRGVIEDMPQDVWDAPAGDTFVGWHFLKLVSEVGTLTADGDAFVSAVLDDHDPHQ